MNTARFDNKVALITGGRTGIGQATAERLSAEGARVFTVQRGQDERYESIVADLSDPKACADVIDEVTARAGGLDILINNAGMMQEASLEEMSLNDWQHNVAVNLTAPFLLIKHALPYLRQTRGAIVNIGSIEGIGANPLHAAYCATKAGLHGLSCAVAVDHGKDGVRCNTVAPGWIDTDLNDSFINNSPDPAQFRQNIGAIHPVGRTGQCREVAALVAFLVSAEAGFITGAQYIIDGGRTAKLSLPD